MTKKKRKKEEEEEEEEVTRDRDDEAPWSTNSSSPSSRLRSPQRTLKSCAGLGTGILSPWGRQEGHGGEHECGRWQGACDTTVQRSCPACYRHDVSVMSVGTTASLAWWLRRPPPERKIPGSNPPLATGFFRGRVLPVTSNLALQWLPCQAPGVIGSALGLADPVSVSCDWVRWKVWSATPISVWQHVKPSEQIRPLNTLACCWDVKQPTIKLSGPNACQQLTPRVEIG